ncbi:hypothetical protein [Staphylococcus aureus]|uniref:hypothetical protein n=1 Tax=Staphylococcus aureus TaxID=1280 RepID=UPI0030F48441
MLSDIARRRQLRRILMGIRDEVQSQISDDVDFMEKVLSTDTVKKMVKEEHILITEDDKFLSDRIIDEMRVQVYGRSGSNQD